MKKKTVYVCSECDYQSAKWMGRCPSCGAWNTFVEETYEEAPAAGSEKKTAKRPTSTLTDLLLMKLSTAPLTPLPVKPLRQIQALHVLTV